VSVRYLLDTDHISFLQRGSGSEFVNIMSQMAQYPVTDFALSIVSFHEQVIGAHNFINRADKPADIMRGYTLLFQTLQGFSDSRVLPFDAPAIAICNKLRVQVRVSTMDLRIAAIALSHNLVVLTRNSKDFSKVPELIIEDWTV
jgi:tRNA(fMet)-specific endonuclease VapC